MIPSLFPYLTFSDFIAFFSLGKDVGIEFERQLCSKFNMKYCLTYSSGRAGLYHMLKANNIKNKSILVSAYTCCVVTEAIVQSGNVPVFIDTKEKSFNAEITEEHVKKHISNLGAIVITNLYGITDYSNLNFLKRDREFLVILDDALSPGHVSKKPYGVYDYVYISCGVRKPFTCLGGGVVFTDNEEKFKTLHAYTLKNRTPMKRLNKLRKFFLSLLFFYAFKPFIYSITSFMRRNTSLLNIFFTEKYHDIRKDCPEYYEDMCDFQKRIGLNQLNKFDFLLERRREIGNYYFKLLVPHYSWVKHYWKKNIPYSHIPFLHPNRDSLEKYLLKKGIDTERYFDYIIPELDQYDSDRIFPNARRICDQIINLPINVGLSEKTISNIVDTLRQFDVGLQK